MDQLMKRITFASLVALGFSLGVSASEPVPMLGGKGLFDPQNKTLRDRKTYQVGSQWGKIPVSQEALSRESETYRRAAMATARVGGATGFILGVFAGQVVVATNHHVCRSAWSCASSTIQFPWLGVSAKSATFLGTWPDIDLALFTVQVSSQADLEKLAQVARNFDWNASFDRGLKLLSMGFGTAENPQRKMVAVQDDDCVVFSGKDEFRKMGDPDELNPGTYQAWSFSHGCDVSHGDSGSAMVDRETGRVVGILWTGRIPKDPRFQDSSTLDQLLRQPTEEVWTQMNYGVPAPKMVETLEKASQESTRPEIQRRVLRALLDQPGS